MTMIVRVNFVSMCLIVCPSKNMSLSATVQVSLNVSTSLCVTLISRISTNMTNFKCKLCSDVTTKLKTLFLFL